ncbi:hypothetical protein BDP27DRAFT_1319663 [Rhodocollybia butyracea]|uniref:Uncharacterized protein n=1 Tax=Rhodocollybia butyracea TaxID=206335 RepID=A0A9P5PV05_9AGAR|nr:hypothetical protein BDP27DRAFT_1319663 [Rhodocollybia butyracea]
MPSNSNPNSNSNHSHNPQKSGSSQTTTTTTSSISDSTVPSDTSSATADSSIPPPASSSTVDTSSVSSTTADTGSNASTTTPFPPILPSASAVNASSAFATSTFSPFAGSTPSASAVDTSSAAATSTSAPLPVNGSSSLSRNSVIGGVSLLALIGLVLIYMRRRRRYHTAPSAEFMSGRSAVAPSMASSPARADSFNSMTELTQAGRPSMNLQYANTPPPLFTPGNYPYPFPEKLSNVVPL